MTESFSFRLLPILLFVFVQRAIGLICHAGECDLKQIGCGAVNNSLSFCVSQSSSSFVFANLSSLRSACKQKFGETASLVTPGDNITNQQVYSLCEGNVNWLGLQRNSSNCSQWIDFSSGEEVVEFFSWKNGEPNNAGVFGVQCLSINEGCVAYSDVPMVWFDANCPTSSVITCGVCASPITRSSSSSSSSITKTTMLAIPTSTTISQQPTAANPESLPICAFESSPSEQAGCLCEQLDGSRSCVAGYISPDDIIFASKPLAYWKLHDTFNNGTVPDSSGNGFIGRFIGVRGVDYQVNTVERFVTFKGGGAYVDFGNNSVFNFGKRNFAIEFRVRSNHSSNAVVISKRFQAMCDVGRFWVVWITSSGQTAVSISDMPNVSFDVFVDGASILDNEWHHIIVLRRQHTIEIFVDGELRVSESPFRSIVANLVNDNRTVIGVQHCGGFNSPFIGDLAEVIVYVDIDSPPNRLCDSSGTWSYLTNSSTCNRVSGFCSPSKGDRQCCAISGCAECTPDYRTCSRNFSSSSSTLTKVIISDMTATTTITTNYSPTIAFAHTTISFVTTSSLPTIIGGAVGGFLLLICIIVLLIVFVARCKRVKRVNIDHEMHQNSHQLPANVYGVLPQQQSHYEHGDLASVAPTGTNYANPTVLSNDSAVGTNYSNANVLN